jgi:nitrate/nitrite-specific signal transduction histidine kinase
MKNVMKLIAAWLVFAGAMQTSCTSASEKVEQSAENVNDANVKLEEEKKQLLEDMETYKKEKEAEIAANEQSIQEFNTRIANQKTEARIEYKKTIDELNRKNSDLKKRIADFKTDSKSNWDSFKTEFGRDMDELGNAFKEFTVKSSK